MAAARIALLDVNVLVALFFADHVHHELAHDWFADHRRDGWATCPITENGFVRVACQQPTEDAVLRPAGVVAALRQLCSDTHHHNWTDTVRLSDAALFAPEFIRGAAQITDVYLLGLAKTRGGYLATFDRAIPLKAVRGANVNHLRVIEP